MKGRVLGLAGILLVTLACGLISPTKASTQPSVETIVAATVQTFKTDVAPSAVPPTAVAPPSGIPVSFQNISFVIPNGIATGADTQVVPAQTEDGAPPWEVAPEHFAFSLNGWSKENTTNLRPTITVYPAQEYAAVNAGAAQNLPLLQAILEDPAAPITLETAPQVPNFNAAQIIVAQSKRLNFVGGSGMRMLNFYAQFPGPIIKDGQFYHYQGLTSDGKYFIIAVLPVMSPLQSTSDNPSADGVTYPDFGTASESEFDAYYQAMTDKLNAATPDSFSPSLNQIDALIQSITITSQ